MMKDKKVSPQKKPASSLPGRLVVVLLVTLLVTGMIPLLFLVNSLIPPPVLKWSSVAAAGLATGFIVRRLLSEIAVFQRLLLVLLILIGSLWLLGMGTQGNVGVRLLVSAPAIIDWAGLGQLALSFSCALLALRAWPGNKLAGKPRSPRNRPKSPNTAPKTSRPRFQPASGRAPKSKKPAPAKSAKPVAPRKTTPPPSAPSLRLPTPAPNPVWPKTKRWLSLNFRRMMDYGRGIASSLSSTLFRGNIEAERQNQSRPIKIRAHKPGFAQVQLVGKEEHRCPYCLELVEKNDARGVVVCSICQTHHHADCWAVTGICQVPHHHE